jgi:hypothetical protein
MLTREGPIIDKFSYFFPIVEPSFTGPSDIEYINIYYSTYMKVPVNDGYSLKKRQLNVSVTGPYPADTHTASLLLYVSTWAILDKKTQG